MQKLASPDARTCERLHCARTSMTKKPQIVLLRLTDNLSKTVRSSESWKPHGLGLGVAAASPENISLEEDLDLRP